MNGHMVGTSWSLGQIEIEHSTCNVSIINIHMVDTNDYLYQVHTFSNYQMHVIDTCTCTCSTFGIPKDSMLSCTSWNINWSFSVPW